METFQANDIRDAAGDLTDTGKDYAKEAANRVSGALDSASTTMGRGVERAGEALKSAGKSTATSIAELGRSVQSADLRAMSNDFIALIRRNPTATFCAGLGAGMLIAQLMRPRRA